MSQTNSLDLLLKEIKDEYVQENFYRLKLWLERLNTGGTTIVVGGGSGGSTAAVWEKFTRSVPASSTIIADSVALSSFNQIEYIINYKNTSTKREKGLKVTVVKDDTLIKEQVYAKTGAPLSIGLNTVINGSNFELQIVSSEVVGVDMSFARLIIP